MNIRLHELMIEWTRQADNDNGIARWLAIATYASSSRETIDCHSMSVYVRKKRLTGCTLVDQEYDRPLSNL